jgi:methionine aminopeptidase
LPQPQKPLPEPPPFKKIEPEKKEEKKPEPKKEPEKKEKPPVTPPKKAEPRQSPQTKPESVTFYDPLGTAKSKKSAEEAAKVEKKVVRIKPFGDAKLRCTPRILSFITRSTVTWSCGRGATESKGFGFDTGNSLLGSVQVTPKKTQTYSVHCTQDGALVAVAECSISVRKDKAADESFGAGVRNPQDEQKNKTLCMFSFCM